MNRLLNFSFLLSILFSCYSTPEIPGFDRQAWEQELSSCEDSKIAIAELVIQHQENLLGKGQAEVKSLLGQPDEHELYRRNQKFFYYNLTLASDSCEKVAQRLSIRFDALDRVKELMIVEY